MVLLQNGFWGPIRVDLITSRTKSIKTEHKLQNNITFNPCCGKRQFMFNNHKILFAFFLSILKTQMAQLVKSLSSRFIMHSKYNVCWWSGSTRSHGHVFFFTYAHQFQHIHNSFRKINLRAFLFNIIKFSKSCQHKAWIHNQWYACLKHEADILLHGKWQKPSKWWHAILYSWHLNILVSFNWEKGKGS